MALNVAVRTFDWTTGQTAGTTIDVNFGFTPKVLIVFNSSSLTADGVSTTQKGSARVGFAGGTMSANRRCICYDSSDNAASAAVLSRSDDDGIMSFGGSTGILDIDSEANWPANSIRFIVDLQMSGGTDQHCTAIAFGGTDIVASTTGVFAEPGSTGNQSVTTTGVNPSVVLFASISAVNADSGVLGDGAWMLGAYDGTRSWVHAMGSDDAALTMDTVAYMKSGQVIALMPSATAVTIDAEATGVSLDSGGFTVNWSSVTAGARQVHYLAIEVATSVVRVDNLLTATDTNQFTDTGYGLTPALAFFVSANRAESTATTPTDNSQLSWGAAESSTVREAQGFLDRDGTANSEITVALETDEVYINLDTAGGAVQGLMDVVSFDSGGMTLVMDDADPAQSFVGVFTIGAAASAGSTASPSQGTIVFTGKAPAITRFVSPSKGTIVFSGKTPTVAVTTGITKSPSQGEIVFTGRAPTATTTQHVFKSPAQGTIVFNGKAPSVGKGISASPSQGTVVFTGKAPTVTQTQHVFINPESGLITFSGYAPTVTGGEAVQTVLVTPSGVRNRRRLRILPDGRVALADDRETAELLKLYQKPIVAVPKRKKLKVKPTLAPEIIAQMQEEQDIVYVMKEIARLI